MTRVNLSSIGPTILYASLRNSSMFCSVRVGLAVGRAP